MTLESLFSYCASEWNITSENIPRWKGEEGGGGGGWRGGVGRREKERRQKGYVEFCCIGVLRPR